MYWFKDFRFTELYWKRNGKELAGCTYSPLKITDFVCCLRRSPESEEERWRYLRVSCQHVPVQDLPLPAGACLGCRNPFSSKTSIYPSTVTYASGSFCSHACLVRGHTRLGNRKLKGASKRRLMYTQKAPARAQKGLLQARIYPAMSYVLVRLSFFFTHDLHPRCCRTHTNTSYVCMADSLHTNRQFIVVIPLFQRGLQHTYVSAEDKTGSNRFHHQNDAIRLPEEKKKRQQRAT